MEDFRSALILKNIVFDKISFERNGFKNDNSPKFNLKVQISRDNDTKMYRVSLYFDCEKLSEYKLVIEISGFFEINESILTDESLVTTLISKNAVAILMPYLRSEVTLLTSQPDMETIILPVFDINKFMSNKKNDSAH